MQPSEKFKEVLRLTRLCARACGADIADPNYKVNSITYFTAFCISVYFIFTFYTIYIKIHEGWSILLQSFCMVGSVLQGISKLTSGIMYTKMFSSQSAILTSLYVKYEVKGKDYTVVLNKCSSRLWVVVRAVACGYVVSVSVIISIPLATSFFTGRRVYPMQFYLPFVDTDTTIGYTATVGMQSTCIFLGAFGNFAGDMFMLVFFAHITLFVDIMRLKIKELNELAEDFGNPMVMELVMDILKWHQTYTQYAEVTDTCMFWINSVQIITSGLSIVLTLFIMLTGDWPSSYAYVVFLFSVMYMYCGMGTIAEVANEDFMDEIYSIHWYNMTISQQKIVGFMLMKSQSPKKITVGGVIPLSVSTGLQVTKTVYSVLMMLVNS